MKITALLGLMGTLFLAPSVSFSVPDYGSPRYSVTAAVAPIVPVCREDLNQIIQGKPHYLVATLDANPQLTPAERDYLVQSCTMFKLGALSFAELAPADGITAAQ